MCTHPVGDGEPLAALREEINMVNIAFICTLKFPSHLCNTFTPFLSYHWEITSPSFEQVYVPNFQMCQLGLLGSRSLDGVSSTNDYWRTNSCERQKSEEKRQNEAGDDFRVCADVTPKKEKGRGSRMGQGEPQIMIQI